MDTMWERLPAAIADWDLSDNCGWKPLPHKENCQNLTRYIS